MCLFYAFKNKNASLFSYKLDIICPVKIQQILIKSLILHCSALLLRTSSRLIPGRCDLDHPPGLSCWPRPRPSPEPSEIPAVACPAPFGPGGRPLSSWGECWEGRRRRGWGWSLCTPGWECRDACRGLTSLLGGLRKAGPGPGSSEEPVWPRVCQQQARRRSWSAQSSGRCGAWLRCRSGSCRWISGRYHPRHGSIAPKPEESIRRVSRV